MAAIVILRECNSRAGNHQIPRANMAQKPLQSKEQALQKLKQYCAYQERCHSEVKEKLYRLGVWKSNHDEIIAALIEENYLNEERFAMAFAGGRWRVKQWGRVKIKYELKQKQVSEYCINKALRQIGEEEYLQTLSKLATAKYTALKKEQYLIRKKKTMGYLLARGFEPELISRCTVFGK
ncbi:MAG: regulatory protein RecX [Bacteroidota bacterium]